MQPSLAQEPKATRTFDLRRISWAMYSCSLVRMPPLKRQTSMLAVGHLLHVADLAVGGAGPEHDVEGRGHVEDLLVDGQHGDFAAAARGRPVDRQLALGFVRS